MVLPYVITSVKPPDISNIPMIEGRDVMRDFVFEKSWRDQKNMVWALGLLGVYALHLTLAHRVSRLISTPIYHLFTPAVFMGILYSRLAGLLVEPETGQLLVTGTFLEGATWVLLVLALTFVVARVRMGRYLLNFKTVEWALTTPTRADRSMLSLLPYLTPLLYPPRIYHVFTDGIVVEGYLYALAIPFEDVQSVTRIAPKATIPRGLVLATSRESLICVQVKTHNVAVCLSPREPKAILTYAQTHLAGLRPESRHVRPVLDGQDHASRK